MLSDKVKSITKPIAKDWCAKLITAWFFVASFLVATSSTVTLESFRDANTPLLAVSVLALFSFFTIMQKVAGNYGIVQIFLLIAVSFFTTVMNISSLTIYTVLISAVIIAISVLYVKNCKAKISFPIKHKFVPIIAVVILFGGLSMYIAIMRIMTYSSPNYDFGLFCNMFYHLKESLIPLTTCERDRLMSHFCVHFSPIYYVLLPFYCLIPSPYTLNIAQTVIVYSGIIPMLLIMRHRKIDDLTILFFSCIYSAYPAIATSSFYDIHENCFLVPILLWLFYFYEKGKTIPFYIFAVLTLTVKEDAFIYLIIFALYIIFDRKDFKKSIPTSIIAIAWFALATVLMKKYGLGIMSDRFSNLTLDGEGLSGVVKTLLLNPSYFFRQIFLTDDNNADKILYFAELFFPLCFMPFMSKRTTRFLLITPVLINLITTYVYQYDISKQYSFGISAFLIYASILSIEEKSRYKRHYISLTASLMAVVICLSFAVPKAANYHNIHIIDKDKFTIINQVLDKIPQDASVSISTFMLQRISDRDEIYELEYHQNPDTDYMIVDERYLTDELQKNCIDKYLEAGYTLTERYEGIIAVYQK